MKLRVGRGLIRDNVDQADCFVTLTMYEAENEQAACIAL